MTYDVIGNLHTKTDWKGQTTFGVIWRRRVVERQRGTRCELGVKLRWEPRSIFKSVNPSIGSSCGVRKTIRFYAVEWYSRTTRGPTVIAMRCKSIWCSLATSAMVISASP